MEFSCLRRCGSELLLLQFVLHKAFDDLPIPAITSHMDSSPGKRGIGKVNFQVTGKHDLPGLGPLNRRATITPANLEHAAMVWKTLGKYLLVGFSLSILCVPVGGNEDCPPNITVELVKEKPLWLHVTVRCRAKARVTFYKYELPWGNHKSMEFVAVTPDEHFIERGWPIDDPSPEKISMEPNEVQSGDVNLQMKLIGLDAAVKKSSVRLFWAYNAPKELNISQWPGGLIIIPRQK